MPVFPRVLLSEVFDERAFRYGTPPFKELWREQHEVTSFTDRFWLVALLPAPSERPGPLENSRNRLAQHQKCHADSERFLQGCHQVEQCLRFCRGRRRPENDVADQEAIESVKYHGDVHAPRIPSKSPTGESHEVEGRHEQRESPVHGLKDAIEEQRHNHIARNRDEIPCDFKPANDKLAEYCRQ